MSNTPKDERAEFPGHEKDTNKHVVLAMHTARPWRRGMEPANQKMVGRDLQPITTGIMEWG